MNRDEKRTRVVALPPEIFQIGERCAIYPREPGVGTWLGLNDAGLCLALINWHRIEREPEGELESRGRIIPQLLGAPGGRAIARELRKMTLDRLRPFRLIVIDRRHQTVTEFQWDLIVLNARQHPWRICHWFSSGYAEEKAESEREKICAKSSLGSSDSLRRLHFSHFPKKGPFSICMHRPDAATVSYSEVVMTAKRGTLRYQSGPPCKSTDRITRSLRCKYSPD